MVLAIVLATFGAGTAVALKAILGAAIFAVLVLGLGPRLFAPIGAAAERAGGVGQGLLAIVIMLVMAACFAMDWAGMHAVLGGFLLGVAMPRGVLAREIRAKLEPVTTVLLVPIFFTFSGLNTQLSIVTEPAMLMVAFAILAVSILSKFGACWAAARLTGQDNPTALGIGALMNARGMMELIIINIGLQRGIIGVELFSMLVLMAVVTTLMASPLFEIVYGRAARARGELGALRDVPEDDSAARSETKAVG
jgi:Kef-type K+ transport system membrane component KefB